MNKNFRDEPGLNRTLLGDGIATAVAGLIGGPPNTTYSENTGVLAITKVYDPFILRIGALFAIALALIPKLAALLRTVPVPVLGGRPALGTWQSLVLVDPNADNPERRVRLSFLPG